MNTPTEEPHRHRRDAPAALAATETETHGEILSDRPWTAARLAREMGLMKWATTGAAKKAGLIGQILVDQEQLLEKLDIAKDGVAHCGQSEVVGNRRLPQ